MTEQCAPQEQRTTSTLLQARRGSYQLPSPTPSPTSTSPAPEEPSPGTKTASTRVSDQKLVVAGHAALQKILASSNPNTKALPPLELHDIPEETVKVTRRLSVARDEKPLKLSPAEIEELTSAPDSLPVAASASVATEVDEVDDVPPIPQITRQPTQTDVSLYRDAPSVSRPGSPSKRSKSGHERVHEVSPNATLRPGQRSRTISSPVGTRHDASWASGPGQLSPRRRPVRSSSGAASRPEALDLNAVKPNSTKPRSASETEIDTAPLDIPLPPTSLPTYLQLELASTRPSPLYIYRPLSCDYPYESSRIKFERLLNFLLLPPQLEQVLLFGTLACLDAWLSTFTILPLRFCKALIILVKWWVQALVREVRFISGFIYHGSGRIWHRRVGRGRSLSIDSTATSRSGSRSQRPVMSSNSSYRISSRVPEGVSLSSVTIDGAAEKLRRDIDRKPKSIWGRRHRRAKSVPSALNPYHKADLLYGLLIMTSSMVLMRFDASRMYHSIRGQNAMKLYVLYNLLEVVDKLLAALGQDILECLTADETIDRGADGRSKILRPFGMFILALIYNVMHTVVLFYHVITLNVAVNSYSNALLALLMSNQFVEIKSSVFKKFEKDNLFQMSCADIVERFQLWLMLVIIGLRNIVEVGGLTVSPSAAAEVIRNSTVPLRSNSILPNSFTILPVWTGEVLSPFLIVLGSETLVDWIKHAYISKFNGVKPVVYQKYLDVLAKDYYTNAFVNQNLIKRLGLPVVPLSCLFIRATVQTYHMFLATHLPPPLPSSARSLSLETDPSGSSLPTATAAALEQFDNIIRMALGRSTFGISSDGSARAWYAISTDQIIASITFILFFLVVYMVALIVKLVLGMILLRFARRRFRGMVGREALGTDTKGKRLGGWGMVEVDDDKRKWIYEDDVEGMKAWKERERKTAEKEKTADSGPAAAGGAEKKGGVDFERVSRYEMSAKRIW